VAADAICVWLEVEEAAVEANVPLDKESLAATIGGAAVGKTSAWLKLQDSRLGAVNDAELAAVEFVNPVARASLVEAGVAADAICVWLEVEEATAEANVPLDEESLAATVEDAPLGNATLAAKARGEAGCALPASWVEVDSAFAEAMR